ncbi:hypothetical protein J437_LFUL008059 [Ladona fulva]|uniref:Nucleoporin Nup133/Nup155-like C-terminal domain-containing protein n=1 Tax=Ladona fulva TaxID=123851 RepID=A0A8K0K4K0_LADFU|nr:hypothetical protein J437_LFUL008059 [Ladona fulva]
MDCYKEVTFLLDQAYGGSSAAHSPPPSPLSATIASTAMEQPSASIGDVKKDAKWLLKASLDSDDTLLHVAIYDWMLQRDLHAELLHTTQLSSRQGQASVKNSLETYLRRASERDPDSLPIQDLLWKYYESISDHASAAKVLQGLANSASAAITLSQRVTYLARAVMCMRSDQVGCAPSLGVFLKQLEDELDVVRIQQKVLDALKGVRHTNQHKAEEAIRRLESELVDIGVLFDAYAEPFGLWECQLAIIYCSGYQDPPLLENIWENILDAELANTSAASSPDNRMRLLLAKVTALGNECSLSPRCFPLAYLTRQLEIRCCRLKADPAIVSSELTSLGIALPKLIDIYDK